MPLILEDLDLTATTATSKLISPKFFSSDLTGNGRSKAGLLNQLFQPVNTAQNASYHANDRIELKATSSQNAVSVSSIPFAVLSQQALEIDGCAVTLPIPVDTERFVVATDSDTWDVFFDMTPQGAKLYKTKLQSGSSRDLIVQYRMELFMLRKNVTPPERATIATRGIFAVSDAYIYAQWDHSPLDNAVEFVTNQLTASNITISNSNELVEWLSNDYNGHDRITAQAELWTSEGISNEVCAYILGLPTKDITAQQLNGLAMQLRYLVNYDVPLEGYRSIHATLAGHFDEDVVDKLATQNLNLLMSHTLSHLDSVRDTLHIPSVPVTGKPAIDSKFSLQQSGAITTHNPLVMALAGAGTGKSSVIISRIDYLEKCGVDAKDVTVLSFTNAAADNISERNPNVGSMTISRMINDIYKLNHPSHELSSIDTIINSIDIFFPKSDFAAQFRGHLVEVAKNSNGATAGLNTFIERRYDDVINLLDTIKQTSLELEIVVCYQKIDVMREPAHVSSKYLIIDEVQDNSIFEFIYVLKYVSKHAQSLFIVGDASQTLYEFRSANPRALNTLEGSGVFEVHKLSTNYRSKQEVLDFANVSLRELETNRLSNIQLQANSLESPTAESFQAAITVDYHRVGKVSEFVPENLGNVIRQTVGPDYVTDRVAAGEQVAFLAATRREVTIMQEELTRLYPDHEVVSLVSDKTYATDIFSKYIKEFWADVLIVPPAQAPFVVAKGIQDNLEKLSPRTAASKPGVASVNRLVHAWTLENVATITGWVGMYNQGSWTLAKFFEELRDNLLFHEIKHNSIRQSLTNQRNRDRKADNAKTKAQLIVSTIHGAKGMEFDNVVVVYKQDADMAQDKRRMFYVAFTRAMKTQYVLAYGIVASPPIVTAYEQIVHALTERDKQDAARADGLDPSVIEDEQTLDLDIDLDLGASV